MTRAGARNAIVYNPPHPKAAPADLMLAFLRLLQERYRALADAAPGTVPGRREALAPLLPSLGFAEAVLEKLAWLEGQQPAPPLQIAILGPTQAGKSSAMNWLAGLELASISPLAGFTVHAQGFALAPVSAPLLRDLEGYFHGYRRLPREMLDATRLDSFSLDSAEPATAEPALRDAVLWDTPDFDSVQSGEYRHAVLRVAALADIVVLVVSKDKYADLSVWEFMRLLQPLAQPTLILLNKTDPAAQTTLLRSLAGKWRDFRSDPPAPVIALPYLQNPPGLAGLAVERQQMLASLAQARRQVQRGRYADASRRLLSAHWPAWSAPVVAEHRLQEDWQQRLDQTLQDCLTRYQRDYLDHPLHYETFQRALGELLTLLEIPGLGSLLQGARRMVTWPVRQLGRLASGHRQAIAGGEPALLRQTAEHALALLGESLLLEAAPDPVAQRWWSLVNQQLSAQRAAMLQDFDAATHAYVEGFRPEIERTARGLYAHLQEHPLVLNSLRATRVTTDAAALAMALHTGGIGVQDFVIAPAMLSVTSLLTESTLGRYMNRAAEQLKQRQRSAVAMLFRTALFERLAQIPGRIDPELRIGIAPETLAQATARLQ